MSPFHYQDLVLNNLMKLKDFLIKARAKVKGQPKAKAKVFNQKKKRIQKRMESQEDLLLHQDQAD